MNHHPDGPSQARFVYHVSRESMSRSLNYGVEGSGAWVVLTWGMRLDGALGEFSNLGGSCCLELFLSGYIWGTVCEGVLLFGS